MARKGEKMIFQEFGAEMLHPESVPSHIRYIVSVSKYRGQPDFAYEVFISDCNRTIRWHGFNERDIDFSIAKIKNAAATLLKIQFHLEEARAVYYNSKPKPRKPKK